MAPSVTTSRSVLTVTTGEAGSGKSYTRCAAFLSQHFLKESNGKHFSNFPLREVPSNHSHPPEYEGETFAERIAKYAARGNQDLEEEYKSRIVCIPQDVLEDWEAEKSGPWEFFKDHDLQDAHITIDEIHNFIGPESTGGHKKKWYQWIGELRHSGAQLEVISQNRGKIPIELRREAGFWIHCKNTETERDPFFRIELGDWYELKAMVTGSYKSCFIEEIRREVLGKEGKPIDKRLHTIDPVLFGLYDSYSAPQKSGKKGTASQREFQKRSFAGLLLWFTTRNIGRIIPKLAIAGFFVWLLMGGSKTLFNWGMGMASLKTEAKKEDVPTKAKDTAKSEEPPPTETKSTQPSPSPTKENNPQKITLAVPTVDLQVLAFIGNHCVLTDGQSYTLGETIIMPSGSARIVALSPKTRLVKLSNGATLRFGKPAIQPPTTILDANQKPLPGSIPIANSVRSNPSEPKDIGISPGASGVVSGPTVNSPGPGN